MRMSAYEAPSDRAFSRATLPSVSSRSGAGYAASARRTTKAPGTISKAARGSDDIFLSLRSSFLSWLSTFLSRGPTVDFSVLAMTASSAPATSGVRAMFLPRCVRTWNDADSVTARRSLSSLIAGVHTVDENNASGLAPGGIAEAQRPHRVLLLTTERGGARKEAFFQIGKQHARRLGTRFDQVLGGVIIVEGIGTFERDIDAHVLLRSHM